MPVFPEPIWALFQQHSLLGSDSRVHWGISMEPPKPLSKVSKKIKS